MARAKDGGKLLFAGLLCRLGTGIGRTGGEGAKSPPADIGEQRLAGLVFARHVVVANSLVQPVRTQFLLDPARPVPPREQSRGLHPRIGIVIDVILPGETGDQAGDVGRVFPFPPALAQFAVEIAFQLARRGRKPRHIMQRKIVQTRAVEWFGRATSARSCCMTVWHRPYSCHKPYRMGKAGWVPGMGVWRSSRVRVAARHCFQKVYKSKYDRRRFDADAE